MTYAELEFSLICIFKADQAAARSIRGRLKSLHAFDIFDAGTPGRGKAIDYTDRHLLLYAIAVSLGSAGLTTGRIVRVFEAVRTKSNFERYPLAIVKPNVYGGAADVRFCHEAMGFELHECIVISLDKLRQKIKRHKAVKEIRRAPITRTL